MLNHKNLRINYTYLCIFLYSLNTFIYIYTLLSDIFLFRIIEIKFMTAKKLYFSLFAVGAIGSISTLLSPLSASAIGVTYTNQTTFLNNTSSTYLENFNSLSNNDITSPRSFSGNGFSYSISATNGFFFASGNTGSQYLSTADSTNNLIINFTSGNVTAVGGNFFLTNVNDNLVTGNVALALNDGTTLNLTSPASAPTPFGGFTTNTAITSLTFTSGGLQKYSTIDNLYVGTATTVPFEFSPDLGIGILGGAWLICRPLKKKFEKKSEQGEIKV